MKSTNPSPSERVQNTIDWTPRFQAVAQAQARYLWILLVLGVFYLALDRQVKRSKVDEFVHLPILGISVDPLLVWATGSLVIAFVLLSTLGTLEALRMAASRIRSSMDDEMFEAQDTSPTAIDFVVYSLGGASLSKLGLVAYPIYLTVFALEATYLWVELLLHRDSVHSGAIFLIGGALLTGWAWWRLLRHWWFKLQAIAR